MRTLVRTIELPRQILRRNRLVRRLCVPEDRHDPPARSIAVQLEAVDPAREWLAVRSALRVVGTEGVQHGAECLGGAVNLAFEKTLPLQARASCGDVLRGAPHHRG